MILTPIFWLIYLILTRIYLELVIILFRIGEDVRRLVDAQGLAPPSGPSAYAPAPPAFMGPAPRFTLRRRQAATRHPLQLSGRSYRPVPLPFPAPGAAQGALGRHGNCRTGTRRSLASRIWLSVHMPGW
jgi:hypothetical protein